MSAAAVIDSLEFARAEQRISGRLSVASLRRLDDVLFDDRGDVHYTVQGGRNERNRPQLELRITGALHLQCQRCLSLLDYSVDIQSTLLLVARGESTDEEMDDPEAPDAIEAAAELDVPALIEDEVLLSLPLAPRHPEGACERRLETHVAGPQQNAFAKLAALKEPRGKH